METTTVTMAELLSGGTQFLTWVLAGMTSVADWALGNELAFLYLAMPIAGAVFGFLFRLLRSV